jgi:hypothetical protein
MKILITDGISENGARLLQEAGHEVVQQKLSPEELLKEIGKYDALIVRSATKVRQDVIDAGTQLKVIGRGGVGLDNIDVAYAKDEGHRGGEHPGRLLDLRGRTGHRTYVRHLSLRAHQQRADASRAPGRRRNTARASNSRARPSASSASATSAWKRPSAPSASA